MVFGTALVPWSKLTLRCVAGLFTIATFVASPASAAYVFVGSWQVYDPAAPRWFDAPPNGPPAYTAQEAAALLFGGIAPRYAISTLGNDPANIDHRAWYDVIGVGGGEFDEDYNHKNLGQFYGPTSGFSCCGGDFATVNAASAFVRDNGVTTINYAFLPSAVPEAGSWVLMMIGFASLAAKARKRMSLAACRPQFWRASLTQ